jgi:hypothetical protein
MQRLASLATGIDAAMAVSSAAFPTRSSARQSN